LSTARFSGNNCGGTLDSSNGTISSPNYPSNYNNSHDCQWKISANADEVSFTDILLLNTDLLFAIHHRMPLNKFIAAYFLTWPN